MVDIGEGKFLDMIVHSLSYIFRKSGRRDGRLLRCHGSAEQGRKGYQKHHQSHRDYIFHVACLKSVIDDSRHQKRNDHLKDNLEDNKNRR